MADKTTTYNMIAAFRRETARNAVSPDSLGSILKSIVDLIDGTVDNANLDTGSSSPAHSNSFSGMVEDDTYTPIIVSELDVQIEPGTTRTLTMNRTADEVLLSAYDDSIVNVIVTDDTITIVALQEEGDTEFSISDEGGSVTVRVTVGEEAAAPQLPMSEIEKRLALKQDVVIGVREAALTADTWNHGTGLMLERADYASPLVTYVADSGEEIGGAFYVERGKKIRVYRNTNHSIVNTDIAIVRIYGDEPVADTLAAPMATLPASEMDAEHTVLELEAGLSGYYALSGLNEIIEVTVEEDVTVADVLAMKQDKEDGKGLSQANFTNAEKTKLNSLPTNTTLTTKFKTIPNDVSRTQTDATFVHSEEGTITNLFYLRSATISLAGLMPSAMYAKLDGLPSDAYSKTEVENMLGQIINNIPGSYSYSATEIILTPADDNTSLITIPSATSSSAGVMSAADKQYLDSIPGLLDDKQDKLPLSTSSGLTDNLKLSAGNNQATAHFAIALGYSNVVTGESGAALGSRNQVTKSAGFAAGYRNACQGEVASTIGENLKVQNRGEVALGKFNTTTTGQLFSVGCGTSDSDRKNAIAVDDNGLVSFPAQQASVAGLIQQITLAMNEISSLQDRISALEGN